MLPLGPISIPAQPGSIFTERGKGAGSVGLRAFIRMIRNPPMTASKSSAWIKGTIAVIDDDQEIVDLVRTMLELEGYQVITFDSGMAALDALGAKAPHLIILDIKMPEMDGMEFLRELRLTSKLPVVFLTGKLDEVDEVLGLKLGADDFIRKPFSQRLLVE